MTCQVCGRSVWMIKYLTVSGYFFVKGVSFHWFLAGLADQVADLFFCEGVGGVVDFFIHDAVCLYGSVEIVSAEAECDLGEFFTEHGPESLDIREVIQHEPTDGYGL